ncbi:hypothetical protein FSARC_1622 [Fusarium sarcochroum]|uniref:Uncharacterized protein n=1 Tax=Fusarium sarcochroum TaxID=1208366 RepID=A0A8H4U8L8_9HYPO|nr:hypothetical protein FSARC_1622 [Fusarium sarcochroum]
MAISLSVPDSGLDYGPGRRLHKGMEDDLIATETAGPIAFVITTDNSSTALWPTKVEKQLALDRLKSEGLGQTSINNKMSWGELNSRFLDHPIILSTYVTFFFCNMVAPGMTFCLLTIVGTPYSGETIIQMELRTELPQVVGAACLLAVLHLSRRYDTCQTSLFPQASRPYWP